MLSPSYGYTAASAETSRALSVEIEHIYRLTVQPLPKWKLKDVCVSPVFSRELSTVAKSCCENLMCVYLQVLIKTARPSED